MSPWYSTNRPWAYTREFSLNEHTATHRATPQHVTTHTATHCKAHLGTRRIDHGRAQESFCFLCEWLVASGVEIGHKLRELRHDCIACVCNASYHPHAGRHPTENPVDPQRFKHVPRTHALVEYHVFTHEVFLDGITQIAMHSSTVAFDWHPALDHLSHTWTCHISVLQCVTVRCIRARSHSIGILRCITRVLVSKSA